MNQGGQLNSMRSRLAQLQAKRWREAEMRRKIVGNHSQLKTVPTLRQLAKSSSVELPRAPRLFKVEPHPLLSAESQGVKLSASFKALKEQSAGEIKQILFTSFDGKKELIAVKKKNKLSKKVQFFYPSTAVRKRFAPTVTFVSLVDLKQNIEQQTQIKAPPLIALPLAEVSVVPKRERWSHRPISFLTSGKKIQQKLVINGNRYFDIVKKLAAEMRAISLGLNRKLKKRAKAAFGGLKGDSQAGSEVGGQFLVPEKRKLRRAGKLGKGFFDKLATLAIVLAVAVSAFYLGPMLIFDVMKVGLKDDRTVTAVSIDDVSAEESVLNAQAASFLYEDVKEITDIVATSAAEEMKDDPEIEKRNQIRERELPPQDFSLPEEDTIRIEKIGLDGIIHEGENVEQLLAEGVVMVSGYGEIGDKGKSPVILAAHRFGYKWWWNSDYARKNSFYYLPDLVVGDRITLIKDQRAWTYEIYDSYEGTEIDNYQADLILYTCRYLNSDVRYFKYARLVDGNDVVDK